MARGRAESIREKSVQTTAARKESGSGKDAEKGSDKEQGVRTHWVGREGKAGEIRPYIGQTEKWQKISPIAMSAIFIILFMFPDSF